MERPRPKTNVGYGTSMGAYYDIREMNEYLAHLDKEIARLKEQVQQWKLQALGPR